MKRMPDEQGEQAQIKKDGKTIYDVGYGSIFFKNFLAGFSRALGTITVYLVLGGLIYYLIATYLIPRVQEFLPDTFPTLGPTIQIPGYLSQPGGSTMTPEEIQESIDALQKSQGQQSPPPPQQSPIQ